MNYNTTTQYFFNIPLQLIVRGDYKGMNAMRFALNGTNQNVWIPKKHLEADGTIKPDENLHYIFRKATRQVQLALNKTSTKTKTQTN